MALPPPTGPSGYPPRMRSGPIPVTTPASQPGNNIVVGHLTDPSTGNIIPVIIKNPPSGVTNTPPTVYPGGSVANGAPVTETGSGCSVCQSPYFPLLVIGGIVGVILLAAYAMGEV